MTSSGYPHFCDLFLSVVVVLKGCLLCFFSQRYQCTFTVWERVWLNDIQLLREECSERGGEGLAQGEQTGAQGM